MASNHALKNFNHNKAQTLIGQLRQQGFTTFIGVDEAGRGPLAGPVVAGAVLLKEPAVFHSPIRDSKKLSPKQREEAFKEILEKAYVGVGMADESTIDKLNILQATYFAMENAVLNVCRRYAKDESFDIKRTCLLVDGHRYTSQSPFVYRTIIKGDDSILSIQCASIVAKVVRDRMILVYDKIYPEYGFSKHKGYPTKEHKEAIKRNGPSRIQRMTFQY